MSEDILSKSNMGEFGEVHFNIDLYFRSLTNNYMKDVNNFVKN